MDGIGREGVSNLTLLIRQETYTLKDSHSCIQPERSISRGKKRLFSTLPLHYIFTRRECWDYIKTVQKLVEFRKPKLT